MRYREVMEGLYLVFQDNHIPWDTINTGYLDKFYDVFIYIEGTEPAPDSLEEVTIDFEEYKEDVRCGLIPLWNLEWVRLTALISCFPASMESTMSTNFP